MNEKIISHTYNTLVPRTNLKRTDRQIARLKETMARPYDEVDTSDSPEWTAQDFARAEQGKFYRPVKAQITAKLDMDVLSWLKSQGPGYQSRMNAILRREMLHSVNASVKHK